MEKQNNAIGIIPVRMSSTRLPGKPLADISGKSLLRRVWENAASANNLSDVFIASGDAEVFVECNKFGAKFVSTPGELPSGTDRSAFALGKIPVKPDIVVNIQCDEPFLTSDIIDQLVNRFAVSNADVGTLIKKIDNIDDLKNPSIVKVAKSSDNNALYFSRSPIPFYRDYSIDNWLAHFSFYKHIGVYAYKTEALKRFAELPPSKLENAEKLEQLRLMENGAKYFCLETEADLFGIDTPEDLERARKIFNSLI